MEVSSSALDFLLIEAAPLATNISSELGFAQTDEAQWRLEQYGFRVGRRLANVLTESAPRIHTNLDIIKFVCKELWSYIYGKNIDNLKTNHKDTYVLVDNNFPFCQRMSTNKGAEHAAQEAAPVLWFPAGIVRGFLQSLGVQASVRAVTTQLPSVQFHILIE